MKTISEFKSHNGRQLVVRHASKTTRCDMTFALFLPPGEGPFPVVWYLSGLTCSHANVMEKGEYRRIASELGIAVICPDTSPRGDTIPDSSPDDWQFGQGAGFYLDATTHPYAQNYQMYSYLVKELPQLVFATYPLELTRQGIFGHSMGGHGAMVLALRNPEIYRSCSAFAPITQPSTADWSQRAFREYLGSDKSNWREWDSVCLIEDGARIDSLLVDQGDADDFLDDGLRPQLLAKACTDANIELTLRMQHGYDHSYFFISSFMSDHMRWHAAKLSN